VISFSVMDTCYEMDMGWVNPWVGFGLVGLSLGPNCNGLGAAEKNDVFYSYVTGLFITYFLTVIPNKRNHIHLLKMAQYLCAPICIRTTTVNSLT